MMRSAVAALALHAIGCQAGIHEPTIGGKEKAAVSKFVTDAGDEDFAALIAKHPEGIFAEFYAPWCGHCKQLAPVYEKVAEKLLKKKIADPPIPCVKVDTTVHRALGQKYKITGYPWLKLFVDREPIDYPDNMKRDTYHPIVNWALQKSGRSIQKVDYTDALTALREKYTIVVLGIFGKQTRLKLFDEAARAAARAEFVQLARDDETGILWALHEPPAVEEGVAHESILGETLADELFAYVPAIDRIMADDPSEFSIRAPSVVIFRKSWDDAIPDAITRITSADLYAVSGTPPLDGDGENAALAKAAVKVAVRQQVSELYRVHNPKKASDLDNLLKKYRGKEVELLSAVRKKYDESTVSGLKKLLTKASLPVPAALNDWTKPQVFDHPAPYMVTLFVRNDESHPEAMAAFAEAAQGSAEAYGDSAGAMQWVTVNGEHWAGVLDNFGIKGTMLPAIRIIGNPGSSKTAKLPTYVFDADATKVEDINAFSGSYVDGSLQPVFKGEDPPTYEMGLVPEGHVPAVVRSTFQELILDAKADILVDVSLSNCAACKSFEPVLARFVKELEQGSGGYTTNPVELPVYKLTIDANDVGDMSDLLSQVTEYPSLALFKADAKDEPLIQEATGMTVRQVGEWLAGRSSWQSGWRDEWKHDAGVTSDADKKAIAQMTMNLPEKMDVDFKTEAPPAENAPGPVVKVVGSTFEKVVLDQSKDVLLEMYAPWCGHCKELAPIYDDVGRVFEKVETVIVAKIDLTANEVDPSLLEKPKGYPTIRLWPKGSSRPVEYEGERESAMSFVNFVEEHAGSQFKVVGGVAVGKEEL